MGTIAREQQGPHVEFIVSGTANSHPKPTFIHLQTYIKNSRETLNLVGHKPGARGAHGQRERRPLWRRSQKSDSRASAMDSTAPN